MHRLNEVPKKNVIRWSMFLSQKMQHPHFPCRFYSNWLTPELVSNIECDSKKINELLLVPFLRLGTFRASFFLFSLWDWSELLKSVDAYADLNEKLLLSPLKSLVRRSAKTVYQNSVWVRDRGLSQSTGSYLWASVWCELQRTVLKVEVLEKIVKCKGFYTCIQTQSSLFHAGNPDSYS